MADVVMLEEPAYDPAKYKMIQPKADADWYQKSYVASNYLGYDKLYYIKDGEDLNVDNEDFVVTEDVSKSQLTKAFKKFTGKKLTNRIVLKSFAEMVA